MKESLILFRCLVRFPEAKKHWEYLLAVDYSTHSIQKLREGYKWGYIKGTWFVQTPDKQYKLYFHKRYDANGFYIYTTNTFWG